jgi:hypothetical protein
MDENGDQPAGRSLSGLSTRARAGSLDIVELLVIHGAVQQLNNTIIYQNFDRFQASLVPQCQQRCWVAGG